MDEIARIAKPPKKPTSTGFPEDLCVKLAINKIGEKDKEMRLPEEEGKTSATDEPTRHVGSMDKRGQSGIRQALGETPNKPQISNKYNPHNFQGIPCLASFGAL